MSRVWLNTAEVAEATGRHPDTVRAHLEAGTLHGAQDCHRGRWRIHRDCVDAWMLGFPCTHRRQLEAAS